MVSLRGDQISPLYQVGFGNLGRVASWKGDYDSAGRHFDAAHLHVARTVCRRAERCVVSLSREEEVNAVSVRYLNRLSDYLFVAARVLARAGGGDEVIWIHGDQRTG